ncbi:hypothetical protein VN12_18850 [Pirellula sp. SH-Sr6A]|nr:hypothetical protein VN12_18850 [Pirellula sp. SH-Sr6A]
MTQTNDRSIRDILAEITCLKRRLKAGVWDRFLSLRDASGDANLLRAEDSRGRFGPVQQCLTQSASETILLIFKKIMRQIVASPRGNLVW